MQIILISVWDGITDEVPFAREGKKHVFETLNAVRKIKTHESYIRSL